MNKDKNLEELVNKLYPEIDDKDFDDYEYYLYANAKREAERAAFIAGCSINVQEVIKKGMELINY